MNVLLLTQVLPYPPDSGPKAKTWNVLKCLAMHYEVTLVSFVRGDEATAIEHLRRYCRAVHTVPIRRGIVTDLAYLVRSGLAREPFLMVRDDQAAMRRLVDRLAADGHFDVVHADQLNMAQHALRVPAARKILDAHNALWVLYRRLHKTMPRGPRRAVLACDCRRLRAYELRMVRRFDAVLAVTPEDRGALASSDDANIAVVPISVDIDTVAPVQRQRGANHIVHIGTMYWPPNIDAVRWFGQYVFPRIRAQRPDVLFDVIGARPPRLIRALGGAGCGINVTGYVDDPTTSLEQAAVMVVPLRAGSGMRVKILNALAQGVPIVSTSLGCSGIAVEPGQHLLVADTAEEFAAATLRLLNDREFADQLARNGQQRVAERYAQRVVCPQLHATYRAVMNGQRVGDAIGTMRQEPRASE
jgi:glycosyltransferase involved in cell wall biosynthesis